MYKDYDSETQVEVMNFDNVRCYQDDNNTLQYKTRDVARELGYERKVARTDRKPVEPTCGLQNPQFQIQDQVRWERINKNLNSLGYDSLTEEQKTGYIPENLVYKLGFHGRTQKAIEFQNLVSDKILPYYREHVNMEEHNRLVEENQKLTKQLAKTRQSAINLYNEADKAIDECNYRGRVANEYRQKYDNLVDTLATIVKDSKKDK